MTVAKARVLGEPGKGIKLQRGGREIWSKAQEYPLEDSLQPRPYSMTSASQVLVHARIP